MNQTNLFGSAEALDQAAENLADSLVAGLSPAVSEALADPIVRALMTADGVDRPTLEHMLRTAAAKLVVRDRLSSDCHPARLCRAGRA